MDAGHGAIDPGTGRYTTAPSKMYRHGTTGKHRDGWFFEGVFNRAVCAVLQEMFSAAGIRFVAVYHPYKDVSLSARVLAANKAYRENGNKGFLFSIHGNAGSPPKVESGNGLSVFVSPNASGKSREIAEILGGELKKQLPENRFLKQYAERLFWEASHQITRTTICPAVLSENGFFTNPSEAAQMCTPEFIRKVAAAHFEAAKQALNLF